jgi:hypothetical protein
MEKLVDNPKLYEINTRVWLRQFDTQDHRATLADVPEGYWDNLSNYGIHIVWLMGVWATNESIVERYDFRDDLIAHYDRTLPGWTKEDVIGSPYAIDTYTLNPAVGNSDDLAGIRAMLHARDMRLMLDFVPNHFSADSSLINTHPEIFVQGSVNDVERDPRTFYRAGNEQKIFAHGRDPYFPAWLDTIQVNYFSEAARAFMRDTLLHLADMCDGVRCDMGMLVINDIFANTWSAQLGDTWPASEFWPDTIPQVKQHAEDFIFMAEAYWDREWQLQQQGFDYTYDKSLTDRLHGGSVQDVRNHLMAESDYQHHSVRFLENHDEDPAIAEFGKARSLAAAVIISTIPGMHFYNDGQFVGKAVRPPVQMGRALQEPVQQDVLRFYEKLLSINSDEIFLYGQWQQLWPLEAWPGNESHQQMLAWEWRHGDDRRLVVVNYSDMENQCRLKFDLSGRGASVEFFDLLNDVSYRRAAQEINQQGLFIELAAYQAHIFVF